MARLGGGLGARSPGPEGGRRKPPGRGSNPTGLRRLRLVGRGAPGARRRRSTRTSSLRRCDLVDRPEPQHRHRRAGGRRSTPCGDAFNAEHGWSRPDDPEPARVEQPGHRAYIEAARLRAGLGLEAEPRDLIRDYLLTACRARRGAEPGRCRRRPAGGEPGGAAPRQELSDGPGPRDRGPVAAERRAIRT